MLINEGGLIRAIKRAYKAGGYTVLNTGNDVAIYTDHWFAMANRALLPRKVLATIVEHMGMIPEKDMPTSIIKDTEPQLVLRETAADDMDHWRGGDRGEEVTMMPVIMQGFQIYQPPGGGACWGVPLYLVDMIERDPAEHIGADVIDKDRLLWEADGEAVVINAVRKACSGWAKEWERAVWNALEGVDLHKEEAARKYETSVTERARRERWQARGCARVVSRKYGTVVVPHGSNFAALLNAAEVWGCDWTEIRDAEVWRADKEERPVPMPHLI